MTLWVVHPKGHFLGAFDIFQSLEAARARYPSQFANGELQATEIWPFDSDVRHRVQWEDLANLGGVTR